MTEKEDLYYQNSKDMANIIFIMCNIINGKVLTSDEARRINYCEKTAIQVKEKFLEIKKINEG